MSSPNKKSNLANNEYIPYTQLYGTLAERSNAEACKALQPWVRIPQVPNLHQPNSLRY